LYPSLTLHEIARTRTKFKYKPAPELAPGVWSIFGEFGIYTEAAIHGIRTGVGIYTEMQVVGQDGPKVTENVVPSDLTAFVVGLAEKTEPSVNSMLTSEPSLPFS
jgi:hypothetical protein